MVLAPVRDVASFNVHSYLHGSHHDQQKELRLLNELVASGGCTGVNDGGCIVDPVVIDDGFRALSLLSKVYSLNPHALDECTVDTTLDADLGWFPPGSEDYGNGPDMFKQFHRYALRGTQRQYPQRCWPTKETLAPYLAGDELDFMGRFGKTGIRTLYDQLNELNTIVLGAHLHGYYDLPADFLRTPHLQTRAVTTFVRGLYYALKDSNIARTLEVPRSTRLQRVVSSFCSPQAFARAGNTLLQLVEYLPGDDPKPNDIIVGEHDDTGMGTLGTVRNDPNNVLTVRGRDGKEFRPVLESGSYFWQLGKTTAIFATILASQGAIDTKKLSHGVLPATKHWAHRGEQQGDNRRGIFCFTNAQLEMPLGIGGICAADVYAEIAQKYIR